MTYPAPTLMFNAISLTSTPQTSTAQTSASLVTTHEVSVSVSGISDALPVSQFPQVSKTPTAVTVSLLTAIDGATYIPAGASTFFGNGNFKLTVEHCPALSIKLVATRASGTSNATVSATATAA